MLSYRTRASALMFGISVVSRWRHPEVDV